MSKWLLIPFYLVLMMALVVYAYVDIHEFFEYITSLSQITKDSAMLTFIELIDMAMIANLGKMIITGSYNSFVSKEHGYPNENISSGTLKVKMSTSLIGVTSIGLLQRSVDVAEAKWDTLLKLGFIHSLFLLGSFALVFVNYLHTKVELDEQKLEKEEHRELKLKHKEHEKNMAAHHCTAPF